MQLFIEGLEKKQFNAEKVLFKAGQILIASVELTNYIILMQDELLKAKEVIANMPDDNLAPAPAPAPVEPVYEIVEAENLPFTIAQFKASKWTEQQLIDAGHLIRREVPVVNEVALAPDAPAAAPDAPAAAPDVPESPKKAIVEGQFEIDGNLYMMTAKAAGASYEKFRDASWKIEALLSEEYVIQIGGEKKEPEVEKTYPFMNAEGDWEDSAGTIWSPIYSMGTNKIPPVTNKGLFKKSRAKAKTVPASPANSVPDSPAEKTSGIPAAPAEKAAEASGIPAAPGAATIDNASGAVIEDEALDTELENIIKAWD